MNVTRLADPAVRRAQYEAALRFYLSRPGGMIDGILFCENSDADLSSLEVIARDENPAGIPVRFFSQKADCPAEYGKGHSELQLMDRAWEAEIRGKAESSRWWKITGRLEIANIETLIATAPKDFEIYLDLRMVPGVLRFFGTDRWADTRIIAFTPEGYRKHLLGMKRVVGTPDHAVMANHHVPELSLFPYLLASWEAGEGVAPRFTRQPVMIGVGAESLKQYNDLNARTKNLVRSAARRLAPSLWL